ncbi:GrpB family protein [Sinorhizobium medicae]|uniref:GrpB family protein n=1 Tax=Sinorhizobium medicae TaxID=110321 RepID=UPI000FD7BAB6|nr:GrpB family protein [Sinorhizobium medicae]RVK09819.1 GrpB family protein [Sinorhizobium medicae]
MSDSERSYLIKNVAPDPQLLEMYVEEVERIRLAIPPSKAFIDHVGSTAVPGLAGKPVIDLLVTLCEWSDAERVVVALTGLGYKEDIDTDVASRRFLERKIESGSLKAIHLHLTPMHSEWGNKMFRDELMADKDIASRYAVLKQSLAAQNSEDFAAYTVGKSEFVMSILRKAAGIFGNDRLLTHQRAELDRAQSLQRLVLFAQFLVALTAAMSVYVNDNATLMIFAAVGFLLACGWLILGRMQRAHRDAGEQARRVVLVSCGLGVGLSPEQRLRIFDKFTVSVANRRLVREEDYFASRTAPSYRRLAELVEESAYWTRDLQRASASTLRWLLLGVTILVAGMLVVCAPSISTDANLSIARVLIAFLVFLLSSDVVGAMLGHRDAALAIDDILQRVETAAARGYPHADVLLIASDYNAAVEAAPFVLPWVYSIRNATLTRRWRAYLENKRAASHTSRPAYCPTGFETE